MLSSTDVVTFDPAEVTFPFSEGGINGKDFMSFMQQLFDYL